MNLAQPNERLEVDMLISDCMDYGFRLADKLPGTDAWKSQMSIPSSWEPSEDIEMHIIRLRKLKDLLMRRNGMEPFKWAIDRL